MISRKLLIYVFILIPAALVACGGTEPSQKPPHQIYFNGQVLTMDTGNPRAEAISARDGVIEAVGARYIFL